MSDKSQELRAQIAKLEERLSLAWDAVDMAEDELVDARRVRDKVELDLNVSKSALLDSEFFPACDTEAIALSDHFNVRAVVIDRLGEYAIVRVRAWPRVFVAHVPSGSELCEVTSRAEANAVMALAHEMFPAVKEIHEVDRVLHDRFLRAVAEIRGGQR